MRPLYEFGRFTLDPDEHRLTLDGTPISVTPKAFDVLVTLVRRAPRLVTKEQLLREVWRDAYVEEANLSVHISALRRTLAAAAEHDIYIETVPRRGYRFVVPVREIEVPDRVEEPATVTGEADGSSERDISPRLEAQEPPVSSEPPGPPAAPLSAGDRVADRDVPVVAAAAPRRGRWLLTSIALIALVAAAIGFVAYSTSSARRGDFSWERIATEGRLTRVVESESAAGDPALSADGRLMAFVLADANGQTDLYVAQLPRGERRRLVNDAAVEQYPRFSPDGDRLLYARVSSSLTPEICIVSTFGGTPTVVTQGTHATWSPDGERIAYIGRVQPEGPQSLFTSRIDGTDVREVLPASAEYPFLRHPAWSHGGRDIAVVRGTGGIAGQIWLVPAEGGTPRRFTQAPAEVWSDWPAFTPDGSGIVYASNRGGAVNLWVQLFDNNRSLRLTTGPGVDGFPTISASGVIAFLSSRHRDELLLHAPSTGATRTLFTHSPYLWAPVFSPDGREVAFSRSEVDGAWHIWTMRLDGDGEATARQITSGALGELHPRYTPDGQGIIFNSWGTPRHVWRVSRDGGTPAQLTSGDHEDGYADPSPDGQWLAFARTDGVERIHVAPLAGGEARPLTTRPSTVPRWSPDGRLIAFSPSRGFNGGIFVVAADGTGERRLTEVGGWPVWWPDGQRISYLAIGANGSQEIWTVPLAGGRPRLLESLPFSGTNYPFDISRDGSRIVSSRGVRVSREVWLLQAPYDGR